MSGKSRPLQELFWERTIKTKECWFWTGHKNPLGYGKLCRNNQKTCYYAHRLSWEFHNGPIPEGMCVLHKCDNPACVRPKHLFLGTRLDNNNDMFTKRRHCYGSRTNTAKLKEADITFIRKSPCTCEEDASKYGVSKQEISRIRRRERWQLAE